MKARNSAIVKQLIDWKADLEASNRFGWTAMYCAAFGFQTKIRMLSEAKADVNAKSR
jgi:hypothetical protein